MRRVSTPARPGTPCPRKNASTVSSQRKFEGSWQYSLAMTASGHTRQLSMSGRAMP